MRSRSILVAAAPPGAVASGASTLASRTTLLVEVLNVSPSITWVPRSWHSPSCCTVVSFPRRGRFDSLRTSCLRSHGFRGVSAGSLLDRDWVQEDPLVGEDRRSSASINLYNPSNGRRQATWNENGTTLSGCPATTKSGCRARLRLSSGSACLLPPRATS